METDNNDLNFYLGGLGTLFQEVEDLVRDTSDGDPGWSILLDVNRIPAKGLDWLAQFVGVSLNHDDDEQGLRQQVRGHDRWGRGTPLSILGPASHYIPGNGKLYMSERNPTPWHVTFIIIDNPGPEQTYQDMDDLFISYYKLVTEYPNYDDLYTGGRGDWDKVIAELVKAKPAGIQYTFITTLTTLYMSLYILLLTYQDMYDDYGTYQDVYSAPFPDIGLEIPTFQMLVSTKYYRNIFNQYETYGHVRDTYLLY